MITYEEFVQRLRDESTATPRPAAASPESSAPASASGGSTRGFARPSAKIAAAKENPTQAVSATVSFATRLLTATGFGEGQSVPRDAVLPGMTTAPHLPQQLRYFKPTASRPHHVILAELDIDGRTLLAQARTLFARERQLDLLEDALDRFARDLLKAFARPKQTDQLPKAPTHETLCVLSIADHRVRGSKRNQLVHFATVASSEGEDLESFTIRQECVDWDKPRSTEYTTRIFHRAFSKLDSTAWKDAFVREEERKRIRKVANCFLSGAGENEVQQAVTGLLNEIAASFGYAKKDDSRVQCTPLPSDHDLAPHKAGAAGLKVPGLSVRDHENRLLGYLVYCLGTKAESQKLIDHLREHNPFYNVIVLYPDEGALAVDLWQGTTRVRGRLTQNGPRFTGESETISFLSRFFVISRSEIHQPSELAGALAQRARFLRDVILTELTTQQAQHKAKGTTGAVLAIFEEFNSFLARFTPEAFADAYAETLTYGLLSARWMARESDARFRTDDAAQRLPSSSPFLTALFARLIELPIGGRFKWLLDDIVGLLDRTAVGEVFAEESDPVIHFYEDFLNAYDPARRRNRGVYYTPDEVVSSIVESVHNLLIDQMGLPDGLADRTTWREYAAAQGFTLPDNVKADQCFVSLLDPATGTGTFLKKVIEVVHRTMMARYASLPEGERLAEWQTYVRAYLLPRLNGFELMMAPYIVAHLRLGLALQETGFTFESDDRLHVYLTNTLQLHPDLPLARGDINLAREGREANALKQHTPITVMVGNPPYDRVSREADPSAGGWVLNGQVPGRKDEQTLFDDILDVARKHTIFSHHASLYNLYVYFWRWAMWKVFEAGGDTPGVVAFITGSSWLHGPGFVGLRQRARTHCDGIWTVDFGGDNKATETEANIFGIETPVAVSLLARTRAGVPASGDARYLRLPGSVEDRLHRAALLKRVDAPGLEWTTAPAGPMAPLRPVTGDASWQEMPVLTDLFPWQQPGCKWNRLWPIAPSAEVLQQRWSTFVSSNLKVRPQLFSTAATGRNIDTSVSGLPRLSELKAGAPHRPIVRYGYRSFDRQWCFDDPRIAALERPALWQSLSFRQLFLTGFHTKPIGPGPALVATECLPDLDYYCGRGGKDIIPLYRDAAATQPNVTAGLLPHLAEQLGVPPPSPEDLAAYVYALLSAPAYQRSFAEELKTPGYRVPLTADAALWQQAVTLGRRLLWLHTYGERLTEEAHTPNAVLLRPEVRWTRPVQTMPEKLTEVRHDAATSTLTVGDGVLAGVRTDVWDYEVSGMPVLRKWLGYRTRRGAGKATSSPNPLDKIRMTTWPAEWSDELQLLVSILTTTLDLHDTQAALLARICEAPLLDAKTLPQPTPAQRDEPPNTRNFAQGTLLP